VRALRRIGRLLTYLRPYALFSLLSVVLMAVVGAMAALRLMLIKPIFDKVLKPDSPPEDLLVVQVPQLHRTLDFHFLVPSHFHNAWTVVAYALVASALLKSVCDYAGTYCVNFAGFCMITDLRNDLYNAVLRRSTAFFQKHTTGTLLSTLINDIERVQTAMSAVLGDALQQVFTFLFTMGAAIFYGGRLAWVLLLFVPVVVSSARRIGRSVRTTTRTGQDKLAEIQNILHETITGNAIVKAFGMEMWEMRRFRRAARRLLSANLRAVSVQAISSPLMEAIGAIGIALLLAIGRGRIKAHEMTAGSFTLFLFATFSLYDPVRKFALFYNSFQQALGASEEIFKFMDAQDDVVEKKKALELPGFSREICFRDVYFGYSDQGEVYEGTPRHVRRGQELAGEPDSALLRCDCGQHQLRRARPARCDDRLAAAPDRQGDAGEYPVQRYGSQQHRVRAAECAARKGGSGGEDGAGARLHPAHAGGLRHEDRRKGRAAERRRAPAAGDRAGDSEERADSDPRRGDQRARHRERGECAGGAGEFDGGTHVVPDRAPAFDRAAGDADRGAGGGADHRDGNA
jgi:ABC-type multidrug transport system fused ATPase/permease subunit